MACRRSAVRSRLAPPSPTPNRPGPHRLVGLGHRPFTATTGVRIPLGTPYKQQRPVSCRALSFIEFLTVICTQGFDLRAPGHPLEGALSASEEVLNEARRDSTVRHL